MLVILHLFSVFLLVFLGFYIFVADPRSRANQTFAAFISFLALWATKDLIFWNFEDRLFVWDYWASASFVIALLMQCALVIFAWVFPEDKPISGAKAATLFAPGLILIPAALFGLLWRKVGFDSGGFVIENTPLAYGFVIYVYIVFGYGAFILFRKYTKYRGTQRGQQVGAILCGLFITGLLKTLANIVLPFFGIYDFLAYSTILVLPGVLIYAYAISNFKLFSFQSALDQFRLFPITYKVALSIASVAVLSFAFFQIPIVVWAFSDGTGFEAWRRYLVFSLISALVPNLLLVLLIVRSISRPLQRITLAAVKVADGEYGTEVDSRNSNDEIGLLAESFNAMSRKMAADIEHLKQLNEQLIRTEKLAAMGTLSAGVAHEINNPLASISSLIQMLRKNDNLDSNANDKLKLIASQISRIKSVTGDMMDFARIQGAVKSPVSINAIIESSLRLASFDKSFRKLEITKYLADDLPDIYGDSDQLQQVFLNFLLNARDAMPDGGPLQISTRVKDDSVIIDIADRGEGIGKDDLKKIFDPFFTTKTTGKGTGLGLAVCYGIVTAHDGKIEASSDYRNGTSFLITLPIKSAAGVNSMIDPS